MSMQTSLQEISNQELIEFYEWKIKVATDRFNSEITPYRNKISELKGKSNKVLRTNGAQIAIHGQDAQLKVAGWKEKISTAFRQKGAMKSSEIFNYLKTEDEFTKTKPDTAFKSITATLSINSKPGGIFKKETVNGVNVYNLA